MDFGAVSIGNRFVNEYSDGMSAPLLKKMKNLEVQDQDCQMGQSGTKSKGTAKVPDTEEWLRVSE